MKWLTYIIFVLAITGILDAGYLTFEHYSNTIPPCSTSLLFIDCGKVLRSQYATIWGIPLALVGLVHYSLLTLFIVLGFMFRKRFAYSVIGVLTTGGLISSFYFVYLQLFVIHAICFYCMISAGISLLLFVLTERKGVSIYVSGIFYRYILKPLFFRIDPETIHDGMTRMGELVGEIPFLPCVMQYVWDSDSAVLRSTIAGIDFQNPVGLAAGFDYEARLTQTLPALGFGFGTIGTITNHPSSGNPRPRLGRLPQSQSLMVNKGFRNPGVLHIVQKLTPLAFAIPIGISVGRTNTTRIYTLRESIDDIVKTYTTLERSGVKHAYYELNISCPNLSSSISFYPPKNLDLLLEAIEELGITRPIFVKMPIEKSDREVLAMLSIIAKHSPQGVIFGNLQKDRHDPVFLQTEVSQFRVGNFSGKPTFKRSNELIKLAYRHYPKRFVIVGCGGIFNGKDAYEKITLGASLVQLITGMIYQGPQLVAQINLELIDLLKKDGFTHIAQAVGTRNKGGSI